MDYSCSIKTHGRRQLELDIRYPLIKDRDKARFHLDCYFFNPHPGRDFTD